VVHRAAGADYVVCAISRRGGDSSEVQCGSVLFFRVHSRSSPSATVRPRVLESEKLHLRAKREAKCEASCDMRL
jgi:hypothetical protein